MNDNRDPIYLIRMPKSLKERLLKASPQKVRDVLLKNFGKGLNVTFKNKKGRKRRDHVSQNPT